MGLLEKASAFARARSLLHRSLELLSEETAAASAPAPHAARIAPGESAEPPVFEHATRHSKSAEAVAANRISKA